MGGNSLLEDRRRLARSPRLRERIGQLLGGVIALRREARELAAEPDDPLWIGAGPVAGRVAGNLGRKERQLRFDEPPSRRGPSLAFDGCFIGRDRFGGSGERQRPRAAGQRRRRIGRQAQRRAEGGRRGGRVPEREKELGVGRDWRIAGRRRGAGSKALAQSGRPLASGDLDQPPRQRVVVRPIAQRLFGALGERARAVAMNLPVSPRRSSAGHCCDEDDRECQPTSHHLKGSKNP